MYNCIVYRVPCILCMLWWCGVHISALCCALHQPSKSYVSPTVIAFLSNYIHMACLNTIWTLDVSNIWSERRRSSIPCVLNCVSFYFCCCCCYSLAFHSFSVIRFFFLSMFVHSLFCFIPIFLWFSFTSHAHTQCMCVRHLFFVIMPCAAATAVIRPDDDTLPDALLPSPHYFRVLFFFVVSQSVLCRLNRVQFCCRFFFSLKNATLHACPSRLEEDDAHISLYIFRFFFFVSFLCFGLVWFLWVFRSFHFDSQCKYKYQMCESVHAIVVVVEKKWTLWIRMRPTERIKRNSNDQISMQKLNNFQLKSILCGSVRWYI